MAKLTVADAIEIQRRYALGGISQVRLGADYGVSQGTVSRIVRGTAWQVRPEGV